MEKATRQFTKDHNRNLVLRTIFDNENISRAEIARVSRLTRTTVSDIVSDLIGEGLIMEIGLGVSSSGKNPIMLSLVEDSRWVIAVDLGQNQFRAAIVNLRGKIRDVVAIPINQRDGTEALKLTFQIIDLLLGRTNQKISGIGIGTPGLINSSEGIIVNAVNLNWINVPLAKIIKDRYNLPVQILNDCQAAAIGEKTYGNVSTTDENLVLIKLHNGIGAGIIIGGEVFQGDGGFAGEIGHNVAVREGGDFCRCGNRGCLETVASAQALVKLAKHSLNKYPNSVLSTHLPNFTIEHIEEAYRNHDFLAETLVNQSAQYIGIALSSLIGILNIQKIVLIGDMTLFGEPWLNKIREEMHQYSMDLPFNKTEIRIGQLGENATILGAAAVFVNNYSNLFRNK
jgi:glucokinase-like ROK family protein